jgi:hypothetical protein
VRKGEGKYHLGYIGGLVGAYVRTEFYNQLLLQMV